MPSTCPACGEALATKHKATHHRRVCRERLAARLAAVLDTPLGVVLSCRAPTGSTLSAARVGPGFTVVTPHGDHSHPTAAAAAADFLDRLRPTD